jgi:hypothetical protein
MLRKLIAPIALAGGWLAMHKPATAAMTGMVAAGTAVSAGLDPWPWAIGAVGAAVVFVKTPPTTRLDAIANALISVMMGGLIAPVAAVAVAEYVNPKLANDYAMALALSCLWPWVVPAAMRKLREKMGG